MKKMKRFLILFMVGVVFVFIGSSEVHGADFTVYPATPNVVIELDFNYPSTNDIYYSVDNDVPSNNAMGMSLYDDALMRYNFINYLFYLKDTYGIGVGSGFVVDIYLPKRRTINGITYSLDWGMFSNVVVDMNEPFLLDDVLGSDYIALKFIYNDNSVEFYDYFDMYILDNTGRYYTFVDFFNGLSFVRFERGYGENSTHDFNLFANISYSTIEYNNGYNDAKGDYGYYDGSNYIPAGDYGLDRYNDGLNENRDYFGINHNGNWLTAEQWGDIRHSDGYNEGLSGEVDWFSWSMTYFLMPFRILNIEILPGIRIGYFALFSLLLGVVGWFFFIVGKGGGRKK